MDRPAPLLRGLTYLAAAALVVLAVGPALFLLWVSLRAPGTDELSLEGGLSLRNYTQVLGLTAPEGAGTVDLYRPLLQSVVVTVSRASLNVFLAALAAYPLARMSFRGRDAMFTLILATMMIPEQVVVVPMFRTVVNMGLYDTLAAVVLPFSVSAFGVFMCRQAFLAIPPSLEEAARIDGASSFEVWWRVMIPLSAPTLATLALFSIIGAWSDLLWPLIVLQSDSNYTLPVAVNALLGEFATNVRLAYAGSVLALLPILLAFLLGQRFLKSEIFGGAVKG